MFECENCGFVFNDDEMSDEWHICQDCYNEERDTELIALDII